MQFPGQMRFEPGAIDTSSLLSVCLAGDEIDAALLKELLSYFVDENRVRLCEMTRAVHCGDRRMLQDLAHTIKGSASLVGAGRLYDLAAVVERDAMALPLDVLQEEATSVGNEFGAVLAALRVRHPEVNS